MRTYFSLVGALGLLGNAAELWRSQELGYAYAIDGTIGAALAMAFLYAAFKISPLLRNGGTFLVRLLLLSMIYRGIAIIVVGVNGGKTMDFVGPALGIAASVYLITNVRRLVREGKYVEAG
jgi:hypothetical protein